MPSKQIIYAGHVQGVGFRYAVKRLASGYDVQGWVKNLDDGRVELQAMADEEEELEAFLQAIQDSSLRGNIKEFEANVLPPLTNVRGFSIVS